METRTSVAPLLSRIKSWQLVALGISGWLALYSMGMLTSNPKTRQTNNAQGGCFALTMTLAGLEVRRFKKRNAPLPSPGNPLQWAHNVTTEQINFVIAQAVARQDFRVERPHRVEDSMGFGVRAVNAGRTLVFETERWKEAVVDLPHVQTTEENRRKVYADLAIIVGAGMADEAARDFVKKHSLQLLVGEELRNVFETENPRNLTEKLTDDE